MPTCKSCEGFVSPRFVRVFGTNEGDVYACPDCASARDIYHGATVQEGS